MTREEFMALEPDEVAALDFATVRELVQREFHDAGLLFEKLEHANRVRGNGQHVAQRFADKATRILAYRWMGG